MVRLEPLYRLRFTYPEGWGIDLEGGWEQYLFRAEGRCEGSICGRFRGANFPRRRTAEGPFCPDLRAVIETDDGASIMAGCRGYGRAHPPGARQIVGSMLHLSDDERYRHLNDVVCVCVGEVRSPDDPDDPDSSAPRLGSPQPGSRVWKTRVARGSALIGVGLAGCCAVVRRAPPPRHLVHGGPRCELPAGDDPLRRTRARCRSTAYRQPTWWRRRASDLV